VVAAVVGGTVVVVVAVVGAARTGGTSIVVAGVATKSAPVAGVLSREKIVRPITVSPNAATTARAPWRMDR
jgi:hypothetical protein